MPKYRKKPVVIEAIQYAGEGNLHGPVPSWIWEAFKNKTLEATQGGDPLTCRTHEGTLVVSKGDYIIQGIQGELYPCKPDIFEQTYEEVPDAP